VIVRLAEVLNPPAKCIWVAGGNRIGIRAIGHSAALMMELKPELSLCTLAEEQRQHSLRPHPILAESIAVHHPAVVNQINVESDILATYAGLLEINSFATSGRSRPKSAVVTFTAVVVHCMIEVDGDHLGS